MFSYQKLAVWQKARTLNLNIYQTTKSFPKQEIYALTNQIRRASISIASNIAEGNGRPTGADKAHFTSIAYGSLLEVSCQLQLACDLSYLTQEQLQTLNNELEEIARMLSALRTHQLKT